MDPISAIGLAQQCYGFAKVIYDYAQAVKSASSERRLLSAEMQNIANLVQLLIDLKVPGTNARDDAAKLPGEIRGPMDRMARRMRDICAKLGVKPDKLDTSTAEPASPLVGSPTPGSRHRFWRGSTSKMHKLKTDLKWPLFLKDEVLEHLNGLERDKTFMTLFLQSNNYMLTQDLQDGVVDVKEGMNDIRHGLSVLLEHSWDSKTDDVLGWLSDLDFASRQRELCAEREIQEATGQWFLASPQFRAWIAGTKQLVFASGVAGSGKTMLASIAIQNILAEKSNATIAFVFFDHKFQREHGKAAILANILKQFLQVDGVIPTDLAQSHEKKHRSGEPPELELILKVLGTWIGRKDNIYIVLDALDEFSARHHDRSSLLDTIFHIAELGNVHILITSRPDSTTHPKLDSMEPITILAQPEDVRRYLEPRMIFMPQLLRRNTELQNFVIDGICEKVQDMFILAQYHLRAIESARSRKEIEYAINGLPTGSAGLDQLYGRCLEHIERQSAVHRERLHRMLDLLVCSRRPLRPDELLEVLTLDIQAKALDPENLADLEDLVIDCEGLVKFDENSGVLRLAHATVHDYLLGIEENKKSECRVAHICLTFLSMNPLLKPYMKKKVYDEKVWHKFKFFDYAARYWGEHVKSALALEPEFADEILSFLELPYRACDGWTGKWIMEMSLQRGMELWKGEGFDRGGHHKTIARAKLRLPRIHHAIFFGLTDILAKLLKEGDDANELDPDANFLPLNTAVQANRYAETKVLLDHAANPNALGGSRAPLNWAAECSDLEIVKVLVKNGADLDSSRELVDPPICCACERDRDDVVEFLIRKGADVDNFIRRKLAAHRTPLAYVMDKGRPKCRELLLFRQKIMTPKRGQWLLFPAEDTNLIRRLIQEAGISPHQTFGLGQGALDIALRLRDGELLNICLQAAVKPRIYHDTGDDAALSETLAQYPALQTILLQQVPPTWSCHEMLEDWKSGDEHAGHTPLRFELPTAHFSRPPSKIIFTIVSHDQGWSNYPHDHGTYHGGDSAFHAEVHHNNEFPGTAKAEVEKLRPRIVQNVHASNEWKEHAVVWEQDDSRSEVRRWMEHVLPGRWIRVVAEAAVDNGWENHVKEVKVQVWA